MNKKFILKQMAKAVAEIMRNKSEFYNYDISSVNNLKGNFAPFFWIVNPYSTHVVELDFAKEFNPSTPMYWDYLRDQELPCSYVWEPYVYGSDYRFFFITPDDVCEIERVQAKEIVRDLFLPQVEKLKKANGGELPVYKKPDVWYGKGVAGKLMFFINDCRAHGDNSLMEKFEHVCRRRIHHHDKRLVYYFESEKTFTIYESIGDRGVEFRCNIKFHGWPETGYELNGSVQLEPKFGWDIHS